MRVVLPSMTVQRVIVLDDSDVTEGGYADDWSPYRIEIETPEGRWVIEGCHDGGPDVYGPDGKMLGTEEPAPPVIGEWVMILPANPKRARLKLHNSGDAELHLDLDGRYYLFRRYHWFMDDHETAPFVGPVMARWEVGVKASVIIEEILEDGTKRLSNFSRDAQ